MIMRLLDWLSHIWAGWHVLVVAVLLTGCATKSPFDGAYWAETNEGRPALCTPDDHCFQMSDEDWLYFKGQMCTADG